jgi:hypothetical protein
LLVTGASCAKAPPAEPQLAKPATIKDIMDSMVDPSGDFLFESLVEIADEKGIRQKAPETDEEWHEVRARAIMLLEAPNLLVMPGRKVAQPGEKSKNPAVELSPEQIQPLVDGDRLSFIKRAGVLQDAAMAVLKAADAKDKKALFDSLEQLDRACENCHLQYWYPNDERAKAAAAAEETRIKAEEERKKAAGEQR